MSKLQYRYPFNGRIIPHHLLIGSSTRRVDAWSPRLELVIAPSLHVHPHHASIRVSKGISIPRRNRRQKVVHAIKRCIKKEHPQAVAGIVFDTRFDTSKNFAHVIAHQICRILIAIDAQVIDSVSDVTVIVPPDCPKYARDLWHITGCRIVESRAPVVAEQLVVSINGSYFSEVVAKSLFYRHFINRLPMLRDKSASKLFVARRGSRSLKNQAEVEGMLGSRGFKAFFPELHPVAVQLGSLINAEEIVGIHGAALAGITMRPVDQPFRIVELFSCSYIVQMYRQIAHGLRASWTGVRGSITSADISLDQDANGARRREAVPFHVQPDALVACPFFLYQAL